MADDQIDCRLVLSGSDFILANHRVHDVPTLPGVAFLDVVLRILAARGHPPRSVTLRRVLFTHPITVVDGADREIRVRIGPLADGGRALSARSRPMRDGEQLGPWQDNVVGDIEIDDGDAP